MVVVSQSHGAEGVEETESKRKASCHVLDKVDKDGRHQALNLHLSLIQ